MDDAYFPKDQQLFFILFRRLVRRRTVFGMNSTLISNSCPAQLIMTTHAHKQRGAWVLLNPRCGYNPRPVHSICILWF